MSDNNKDFDTVVCNGYLETNKTNFLLEHKLKSNPILILAKNIDNIDKWHYYNPLNFSCDMFLEFEKLQVKQINDNSIILDLSNFPSGKIIFYLYGSNQELELLKNLNQFTFTKGNIMSGDSIATKIITIELQENGIFRNTKGRFLGRIDKEIDFNSDHIYEEKDRKMFHVNLAEGKTIKSIESDTEKDYFISKEVIEHAYREAMNQDLREQDFNSINKFSLELYKILDSFNTAETFTLASNDDRNMGSGLAASLFSVDELPIGEILQQPVNNETQLQQPTESNFDIYTEYKNNELGKILTAEELKSAKYIMDQTKGGCTFYEIGRGDCSHYVGLPGISIPGKHDGSDDTVNAFGKPNGWCWSCWKSHRIEVLEKTISDMELAASGELPDTIDKTKEISASLDKIMKLYQSRFELMTKLKHTTKTDDNEVPCVSDELKQLENNETYRMQMAGISTAAIGYWKVGDDIHADYGTQALLDVADLYKKYAEKYKLIEAIGLNDLPNIVSKDYLTNLIGNSESIIYHLFPGTMHTTCCVKLPNGASFIGESVCASQEVFDEIKGRKYAFDDLIEKLWAFEGYVLKYKRFWAGLK